MKTQSVTAVTAAKPEGLEGAFPLAITYHVRYSACMKCPIHKVELICYCPACRGEVTSKRKAATSRENGKLGGRPKGSKNKPKSNPQRERR